MFTVDLDLREFPTEEDLIGASYVPPGKYHAIVTEVTAPNAKDKTPCIALKYKILAGTDPVGVGMCLDDRVFLSEKAMKRVALVALRLGLISRNDLGKNVKVNWLQAKGRQVIIEVADEEFERKDGTKSHRSKVTFGGTWDLNHADVRDVPRGQVPANAANAASGNGNGGQGSAVGAGAGAGGQTEDWSDV